MTTPKLKLLISPFLFFILLFMFNAAASAQTGKISGKITNDKREPLAGASVTIKNIKNGATSGADGVFAIDNVANGNYTLVISFVGYTNKELKITVPQTASLGVTLNDDATGLGEVVVTGVFDKRTALNSSIAITSLSRVQIERSAPNSAAALLRNVPGVYVNSSLGEVRKSVISSGVTTGNNDGRWGYDYVSMQEDGLPITTSQYANYGPDFFLRADAAINKVEAVRGGTASIVGANAPGGIFNYISRTGGDKFEGELRTKFGLVRKMFFLNNHQQKNYFITKHDSI